MKHFKLRHFFLPGIYVRELSAPAGSRLVGKTHKKDHIMMLQQGRIQVISEQFTGEIAAPFTITCEAGAKRAAFILEDAVWVTVHPTNKTDLAGLEEDLIVKEEIKSWLG